MLRQTLVIILLVLAVAVPQVAVTPKDELVITSDSGASPVKISPAEFRSLEHTTVKVHNSHKDADETYSGVPLVALLGRISAPVGKELRKEAFANYVVATGADGYKVVLSLAEIDPSFHAGQVLVADTRDGEPLGSSGPFQLIVTDDKRPARWVHNLNRLALFKAN